ncbi:MAG TPA: thymidylate kinase, partial [Dehalococcoidia bacterium]|nr:thymidylate kinase [Dehalococcoidia bacterium]
EAGLARAGSRHERGHARDSLGEETLDFHKRVREGFLAIARKEPERVVIIDAAEPKDRVADAIWSELQARFTARPVRN